jgi:hypothetical protein
LFVPQLTSARLPVCPSARNILEPQAPSLNS